MQSEPMSSESVDEDVEGFKCNNVSGVLFIHCEARNSRVSVVLVPGLLGFQLFWCQWELFHHPEARAADYQALKAKPHQCSGGVPSRLATTQCSGCAWVQG